MCGAAPAPPPPSTVPALSAGSIRPAASTTCPAPRQQGFSINAPKLSDQIKSTEAALHTNMELKAATVQYAKTRPVFEKYKASKYSRKFLAEHEADIELYRAACADFKRILDGGKLPKMDALKEDGRKLSEQKKKLYAEYRKAKADMQEVTTIKANIDYLLGYAEPGRKKEQER